MTDWGVLDGGASAPVAPTTAPAAPAAPATQGWGRPDGGVVRQRVATSAPGASAPPPADIPPPEATASLLRGGEHLWAKVDRQGGAALGSGQRLRLPDGVPDDFYGWRRVQIVDPAVLSATVLPIPWEELEVGVGDDPAALYHPEPVLEAAAPERVRAFPVGSGPDLERLFEERVGEAVQEQWDRATRAERAADQRAQLAERAAAAQSAAAEQNAREHIRIAENRAAAAEHAAEERIRDAESRAGAAVRDARQRVVEAQARAEQAEATVQQRAEQAERAARQRADHAEMVARERGEAAERWAADVQRAARQEVAEAQTAAAEANATVEQRSAEAVWKAEQQVEMGRRAVQGELSGLRHRTERLRRTVAALAAVTVLMFLVAILLGWLAFGSAA